MSSQDTEMKVINGYQYKRPVTIYDPAKPNKWVVKNRIKLINNWFWPLELNGEHYQMCTSLEEAKEIARRLK